MKVSCQLFEFEGYPCRHMLCWMKVMQVMMLPDKYIIERWTKKVKIVVVFEQIANLAECQSFFSRRIALARIAMELVSDCSLTEARNNFLMGGELKNLMVKAKDIDDDINIVKAVSLQILFEIQIPFELRDVVNDKIIKREGNVAK
ncbi:hypothetical protein ACS0TY_005637 [Phlomoides rotata]